MNREELMKMLNVKPSAKPLENKVMFGSDLSNKNTTVETSPHALKLDLFDQAQGDKLLRYNHRARETKLPAEHLSDFHAAVFLSEPVLNEMPCSDERKSEYITTMFETPAYKGLHKSTEHNPIASELAAVEFAQEFAKLVEKDEERKEKEEGNKPNPKSSKAKAAMDCLRAVGNAVKKAEEKVEEYDETCKALGMGDASGTNKTMDVSKVASIFQRVKEDRQLKRIMELAGRFRRVAQSQQRKKVSHGYDDMVGVELNGDVGKLLPHELAMLSLPETEDDALRRLVERQSMCRKYRGYERVGKGSIVICCDESGSMSGEPIAHAKAFALAMAHVAKWQKRFCVLIGYSGGTDGTKLILSPGRWDESALLDWLEHNFGGGTDLDVPLEQLPRKWWNGFVSKGMPRGKTDLILISDAICSVPNEMEKNFLDWKVREKVKCISLVLASSAGGLAKISDEVHLVRSFGLSEDAIQKCLGI